MAAIQDKCFAHEEDTDTTLQVDTLAEFGQVLITDVTTGEDLNVRHDQIDVLVDLLLRAKAHLNGQPTDSMVTLQGTFEPQAEGHVQADLDFMPDIPSTHASAMANVLYHTAKDVLDLSKDAKEAAHG